MRLIDADELEEEMYYNAFETDTDMQKWESGCWVRYKMFENILEKQPTIEAIPIEWIEQWAKERNKMGYTIDMCYTNDLIIDWRKENEDKNI